MTDELEYLRRRAERCVTHYYGCDCREYRRAVLEAQAQDDAELIARLLVPLGLMTRFHLDADVMEQARTALAAGRKRIAGETVRQSGDGTQV